MMNKSGQSDSSHLPNRMKQKFFRISTLCTAAVAENVDIIVSSDVRIGSNPE